jgi:hypothetical protein
VEHACRAARNVLHNTYNDRWIGAGLTAWPPRSSDLNPLDFTCDDIEIVVYASPVDNEEAFHCIVDVCRTIRSCPENFERMRRSVMSCVEACIKSHVGNFEHLL